MLCSCMWPVRFSNILIASEKRISLMKRMVQVPKGIERVKIWLDKKQLPVIQVKILFYLYLKNQLQKLLVYSYLLVT